MIHVVMATKSLYDIDPWSQRPLVAVLDEQLGLDAAAFGRLATGDPKRIIV